MTNTISSGERLDPQAEKSSDLIFAQESSQGINNHTSKTLAEQSTVQPLASELQIVHATPGRVRIRATGSMNSELDSICQQLKQQDSIKEVSVNQETGSLVIIFDENKLSLPQMLVVLQEFGIDEPQASPQTAQQTDPFAEWKSLDYWKDQGISFIPLITGLLVTGRLGIQGLAAIPVYMVTADATRRVIEYLEPVLSAVESSESSHTAPLVQEDGSDRHKEDVTTSVNAQPAKISYTVVHTIPGRVRFNVPRIASDRAYARRLERLLKTDAQVANVRVNHDAASVAIAYQSVNIPVSYWVDLIQLADEENTQTKLTTTTTEQPLPEPVSQSKVHIDDSTTVTEQPTSETVNIDLTKITEQPTPEVISLSSLWTDLKAPALSTSLAFMANLSL